MFSFGRHTPSGVIYDQSAVIPFRGAGRDLEVLLITNLKGTRWVVPKGLVEPNMEPGPSAAKEAEEEAGVAGQLSAEAVGQYDYKKWGGVCEVEVYLLRVTRELDDYEEKGARQKQWLPIEEAAGMVRERALGDLVRALPADAARLFPGGDP